MNTTENETTTPAKQTTFYIKGRGWQGKGMLTEDGFTVFAGSIANEASPCFLRDKYYYPIRKALEDNGVIVNGMFLKDFIFKSAAQAGCVIAAACIQAAKKWHTEPDADGKVRTYEECCPKASAYIANDEDLESGRDIDPLAYASTTERDGMLWRIEYRGQPVSRFACAVA